MSLINLRVHYHEYTYNADGNLTQERNKLTGETKKFYWDGNIRDGL